MKKNPFSRKTVFLNSAKGQKNNFKRFGILCVFALMVQFISMNVSMAEERYKGILVVDKGGNYALDDKQHVELVMNEDIVESIKIHINAANKDLTFSSCIKLQDDGSNFTKWFSLECRTLHSYDGKPFMYDSFLTGAYAGISPRITPAYLMYKKIKEISDQLGLDVPSRTFVIYADKKPIYEFFCYPEKIKIR